MLWIWKGFGQILSMTVGLDFSPLYPASRC